MFFKKHWSDNDLIAAIRSGSRQALEVLYRMHWPMIHHFVKLNGGSTQDAEDLYQDCVLIFYEKAQMPAFELSSKIKTYLYAICRNNWLNRLRGNRQVRVMDISDPEVPTLENHAGLSWSPESLEQEPLPTEEHLLDAINRLGNPCQGLLIGFYYEGLTMEQLAVKFNRKDANNAKQQRFKCMERLKKMILTLNSPT